ncbi:MAG: LysM repeat protein [Cellvibrionaceae bacterium]|jgi:LysM repeat protein
MILFCVKSEDLPILTLFFRYDRLHYVNLAEILLLKKHLQLEFEMKKNSSKTVFFASMLMAILVLSGCGLNQRSSSQSDPVPVTPLDVIVTDPTADQSVGEDVVPADPAQPVEGGENQDPYVAPEEPTAEEPAAEEPAAEEPAAEEPAAEEPAVEQPAVEEPVVEQPATNTTGTHPVQAGETLFIIAQRYGLTIGELAAANGITNPNILGVGEELVIPVAGTVEIPKTASVHIVSYGDTIYNIALRYGFTVEELALHNELQNVNRIDIGQEIKIPSQ